MRNGPNQAPLKDYTFECVANVWTAWTGSIPNVHFWDLVQAEGFVTIQIKNYGTLYRRQGQTGEVLRGIESVRILSTTNQTVILAMGDDRDTNAPGDDTVQGVIEIEGSEAAGTTLPTADMPNPVISAMVKDNGDGTETIRPLQTYDGQALVVGHVDTVFGFLINPGATLYNVIPYGTLRLSVSTADAADAQLLDQFGQPLAWYEADGTLHADGVIPGSYSSVLWVPVVGVTGLMLTSGGGNWSFWVGASSQVFKP